MIVGGWITGVAIIMLILIVIIAIILWFSWKALKSGILSTAKMTIAALVGILCFIVLIFYIFHIEPKSLNITRTNIDINWINEPIKIVFITDIHAWSVSDDFLTAVVQKINAEKQDFIFLGGDYITGEAEISKLSVLSTLSAKKGVYAVMGNHDYAIAHSGFCANKYENELADKVVAKLKCMNITVLRNEHIELSDSISIVGLDDFWSCKSNYSKAMESVNQTHAIILLTHNQEAVPQEEYAKLNLVLAGHTHCGQIRLPIIGSLPKLGGFKGEYEMGLHQFDKNSYIYTSCGIGNGPRFLAPPEISIVTIQ